MDILHPAVEQYIDDLLPQDDPLRAEMERYAEARDFPIVGPQVGHLLFQLAALRGPSEIFELGSGFGYSAFWMLKGCPGARIICTERSEENIGLAQQWMKDAGLLGRMTWHRGEAFEVLSASGRKFDLIFNDVDKTAYPAVFALALERLHPGGLLVTDNVLWHGSVTEPGNNDAAVRAIREYNRLMFATPGVASSIVPLRDGVGITMKL